MAPPLPLVSLSELEQHATSPKTSSPLTSDAARPSWKSKAEPPRALTDCALKEMTQYKCNMEEQKKGKPLVVCLPLVRLFRECANGLHVETTAWEEWKVGQLQKQAQWEGTTMQ